MAGSAITRKLVAATAGALVVSGGRFYIHADAPALPAATLTSDDLRGDVTIVGSHPLRVEGDDPGRAPHQVVESRPSARPAASIGA